MDETDLKIEFEHYRIPAYSIMFEDGCKLRGIPLDQDLFRYSRKDGFLEKYLTQIPPHSRGGKTICRITSPDGRVFIGVAICSLSDNFNYRQGRNKARGRALSARKNAKLLEQLDDAAPD